jgi:hypothetical protein
MWICLFSKRSQKCCLILLIKKFDNKVKVYYKPDYSTDMKPLKRFVPAVIQSFISLLIFSKIIVYRRLACYERHAHSFYSISPKWGEG